MDRVEPPNTPYRVVARKKAEGKGLEAEPFSKVPVKSGIRPSGQVRKQIGIKDNGFKEIEIKGTHVTFNGSGKLSGMRFKDVISKPANGGEIGGRGGVFGFPIIFLENDIQHPVKIVLNAPMSTHSGSGILHRSETGYVIPYF